ncbi:MAG: hypothetical protein WBQ17_01655 [Rhizomicrobium sp.]
MKKYEILGKFLRNQRLEEVPMTFAEIEHVTGTKLPRSQRYPAWWSNNTSNNVMTKIWLDAGFRTESVDVEQGKLVFRRVMPAKENSPGTFSPGLSEPHRMFKTEENIDKKPRRSPLFGALKGTFTIEPGWDITKPALDPEELAEWDASLDRKADLYEKGLSRKP